MRSRSNKGEWLYGINPVMEAIKSGRLKKGISTIYLYRQRHEHFKNIVKIAETEGISIKFIEKNFFDARFQKGHQGIATHVLRKELLEIEDLLDIPQKRGELPFLLILDRIEDPRNFGAILRVADTAGMHGVVFQTHRAASITPVVSKASAGAIEHVNLAQVVNIKHAIEKMKQLDITVIGAEADSELTLWDIDMNVPLALVIGSEGHGLRRTVKEMCSSVVSLPMRGKINSLNVSVAVGILSYEVIRQRLLPISH